MSPRRLNVRHAWLLAAALLVLTAGRLPAPIQEIRESPTPTAKPKKETTPRPKPKASPNESTGAESAQSSPAKARRFAGKWVGVMPEVPWGNVATELTINEAETSMHWTESGKEKGTGKARIVNGDTIQADFMVGVAETWSITPLPDGTSARVRLSAFMNNGTATFHRAIK